jgi:ArsR family metal-binding transcriptional regulator
MPFKSKDCHEMLIEKSDLEIFTPPCDPGAERYAARARLVVDISEALPYLNATLIGAHYHPEANALTWKKDNYNIAFHAYEIDLSNAEDRNEADQAIKMLVELVNQIWERRGEIVPDTTTHQPLTPLEIYDLLPRTNCRQCGEPTCYTFALKLAAGQKNLVNCPPLSDQGLLKEMRLRRG